MWAEDSGIGVGEDRLQNDCSWHMWGTLRGSYIETLRRRLIASSKTGDSFSNHNLVIKDVCDINLLLAKCWVRYPKLPLLNRQETKESSDDKSKVKVGRTLRRQTNAKQEFYLFWETCFYFGGWASGIENTAWGCK